MTTDAGTAEIAAHFQAGLGAGVAAGPAGSSGDIMARVWPGGADRRRLLLESMRFVPMMPVAGAPATGALLLTNNECGPRSGFCWAVQRILVAGLLGADTMIAYKGPQPGLNNLPQLPNQISPPLTVASPAYHAGGKGIIMNDSERLAAYGTGLTTAGAILTAEVIEFESCFLADFLI